MADTHYARPRHRLTTLPKAYAMIFGSQGRRVEFVFVFREAGRSTPMMAVDRSKITCRAIFFLFVTLGLPKLAQSGNLEDSAMEFARKIAATSPAGQSVSWEIRNLSSLRPEEVSEIEQALKSELEAKGVHFTESGIAPARLIVTLSENWNGLIWTAEIHQGDASQAVLLAVTRYFDNHFVSNAMHVTVRSERYWEGPERVLDATETTNGNGKSWLVLLQPANLTIQDLQTGSIYKIDFVSEQLSTGANSRDPWGQFGTEQTGNVIWFSAGSRICSVDLESHSSSKCLSREESETPASSRLLGMTDLRPGSPASEGKGIELTIAPVCNEASQFLASSARDYTQTDSLQVFQMEPNGPVPMSGELDFPGPIMALHTGPHAPRAIVRNLTTGNYEAYRLAISCGQ